MKKRSAPFIQVTVDKKVAYALLVLVAFAVAAVVGISANVDVSGTWHYLQGIAKSQTDMTSVDSTGAAGVGLGGPNGAIDKADSASSLNGVLPSGFCAVGDTRPGCAASGSVSAGVLAGICRESLGVVGSKNYWGVDCEAKSPAWCGMLVATHLSRCNCPAGYEKTQMVVVPRTQYVASCRCNVDWTEVTWVCRKT